MRLLAWNLNHRTRAKPIPAILADAVLSLNPDVVILTEYVSGEDHDRFTSELATGGLGTQFCTPAKRGFNQVLVAARGTAAVGDFVPPADFAHGAANCLHLRFARPKLDLVGLRVPIFKAGGETRAYWDWLEAAAPRLLPGPAVIIGDLNADPRRRGKTGPDHLRRLEAAGWQLPHPKGAWSFISHSGATSRVDHAVVSPGVPISEAAYLPVANGYPLAGAGPEFLSDHAPLVLEVDLPG